MAKVNEAVIVHIDAILKEYDKQDPRNFIPPVKEGVKEFFETIHNLYPEIHVMSDINAMIVQKVLRDSGSIGFIKQIDLVELDSCIFIGKNSVKFNNTTESSIRFTSILNYVVNFLNKAG